MRKIIYSALVLGAAATLYSFAQKAEPRQGSPAAASAAPATAAQSDATSENGWYTDHKAALATAQKENKAVFMNFTGSDWCGWCIRLKKEVFETPEFKAFAKDNLVLEEVDFPRSKKQSISQQKQNQELAEAYGIQGYPTIIILNAKGDQIGQTGYMRGGPGPFIAELKKIIGQ